MAMRYMVIVKATKETEAGILPSTDLLNQMGKLNAEMVKAGVLLAGDGLQPSSSGARVRFEGSKRTVVDGPFAETKELVSGFWILQVKSKDEAIEWAKRVPFTEGEIEVRRISEAEDFGDNFTPEMRAAEDNLRMRVGQK
jgi:hypothetical protein